MTLCKANMLFVILVSYTVLLDRCTNADELLMQTFSKVLSLDKRMDNLEIKLENSLTDLQTQLAEGLERIAETQKNYEPKLSGITESIQSTISNTVTKMVKSQFIAINTAMKREKVTLRNLITEMNNHMKAIDDEFENKQRNLEDSFLNKSIIIDNQIRAQTENVSDVMNDVIIRTNAQANELKMYFDNAQSSLDERFSNQSNALDYTIERQSDDIGERIREVRNEKEQLKGNFSEAQNSLYKAIDKFKEEMKITTFNLEKALKLRITNQDNQISSLGGRISSNKIDLGIHMSIHRQARDDIDINRQNIRAISNWINALSTHING
ncbi:uncharacterized protein LOC128243937 [Mya arenaria]|uniref:uncharacterized protein LOC128243937 n=1 Tax=Mya arenaria TaxID=6604 RepID=UPI0022E70529|nr:uncharacterized protein LOC128243937 [Mya arenaria]